MLGMLHKHHGDAVDRLAAGALAELQQWTNLQVREVPDTQAGQGCSVAGAYFPGPPPVLAVARSVSLARRDFTALHELGHHLQQNHLTLIDALLAEPDGGTSLEDAACDAFAAEILLPDTQVDLHMGTAGPTADDAVALWHASNASRMATCVKASERLPAPGHVFLLDSQGRLAFTASHGLPPLRRGSNQAAIPVISTALATHGRAQGQTRLRYRDGILGEELHIQTVPMGGYLLAIAVTDLAPWKRFAPSSRDTGPRAVDYTCAHCGEDFVSFAAPCTTCEAAPCPECGRCDCASRVAERQCPGCFVLHPAAMYTDGSDRCRDCE
ncbi:ImmA/IrrE family metallo-endopeptidase [Streptomyces sp. ISL-98]|nr:ImmA/IrrE family metallo-endopeptidase [Streptomyces sp. ISL-98]